MRNLLLKLHLVVALAAALFVTILGLTGAVMAFEPELDDLFHHDLFHVSPSGSGHQTIAQLADVVGRAYPGERVVQMALPQEPDGTYAAFTGRHAVYLDGSTGRIVGARTGPGLLGFVHQLHIRLALPFRSNPGGTVVALAGMGMLFLVVSGVVLWWKQKQVRIRRGGSLFRTMFDTHSAVGIFSAAFLLVLSASGILVAYDRPALMAMYRMTGEHPAPRSLPSTPQPGVSPISAEKAVEQARAALPGAVPLMVSLPRDQRDSYDVRMRFPEDRTPGGRSWVSVDQYTGRVLVVHGSRTAPGPERVITLNRALHTGDLFGLPTKLLMSLSSLLVVVQTVSGLLMWTRRRKAAGRP